MGQIFPQVVKEDVAGPSTEDDAEGNDEYQIGNIVTGQGKFSSCRFRADDEISGDESENVHETIPAKFKRTQAKKNRIDVWELHDFTPLEIRT
jgi:hypothetical protein